ncbi:MAG: glycosyltransferase family A protein [Aliarcobacter skirrowii]|nr:glycosyltransferase family A protein [Aliarcobacter skirrowii]MDD2509474.1 glycosyltransferase family A protein [Aliarcobacter skirrowii]
MKKISVIIPCYNDPNGLKITLESLKNQSLDRNLFEVIVGNDGASKDVERVCKYFNASCVNIAPRSGVSVARNRAVSVSSCDLLAFVDSDISVDYNWLKNGIKALNSYEYVGGKIIIDIKNNSKIYNYYEYLVFFDNKKSIERFNYFLTGNLFLKRGLFLKNNGFDERFFCGAEDLEFGNRLAFNRDLKFFYCENAIVNHPQADSLKNILKKMNRNRESSRFLYSLCPDRFSYLKQGFLKPFKIIMVHPLNVLKSRRKINKFVKIKVFFWSFYLGFLDSWQYIKSRVEDKNYHDLFR